MITDNAKMTALYSTLLLEFSESTIKKLVSKFMGEDETLTEETVKDYLKRFEKYKGNPKIVKKDLFQYKWKELENVLDANFPVEAPEVTANNEESLDVIKERLKVYEDDNIIIHKASNQGETVLLGQGYTFCISRKEGGNLYIAYRLRAGSTFYFARLKHKDSNRLENGLTFVDPSHMIVMDAQSSGKYQWTWADNGSQGHGTKDVTVDEAIQQFPEFSPAFEKKIFKNDPISDVEREKLKKFQGGDFNSFTYNEKMEYVKSGYTKNVIFKELDKKLRNEYLGIGHTLTSDDFKSLSPSERGRWITVSSLLASTTSLRAITFCRFLKDNGLQIKDMPENVFQQIIKIGTTTITEFLVEMIRFDENFYNNIPKVMLTDLLKSPASSYSFVYHLKTRLKYIDYTLDWKTIPKIFLKQISKDLQRSFDFIIYFIDDINDIPIEMLSKICKASTELAAIKAKDLIHYFIRQDKENAKKIPKCLFDAVTTDSETSYGVAHSMYALGDFTLIPEEIINSILRNATTTFKYVTLLLNGINPHLGHNRGYSGDVPENMIEIISKNPHLSCQLAEIYLKKVSADKIPERILNSIVTSYQSTLNFATMLKNKNTPIEAIPKIIMDKLKPDHKIQLFGKIVESLNKFIKRDK